MQNTDVLIVGAGPTGLSLACQLLRHGIDFVIVEKNEGVTPYSKAIGVHARTLEIYEQLNLAQQAVKQGTIAGKARLLVDGEVRGELDFSHIGQGLSSYPYVLMLEQSKNERLLHEYLQSNGREVQWQTELQSFDQSDSVVTAKLQSADGTASTVEAKYLVGCDGPKSLVRHTLGLGFSGSTFERTFYVADAQVDWKFTHDAMHACLAKESFCLFFPLKGEKRYRIVGVFPDEFAKDAGDVLYEEIEARIKELAKLDLDIHDVEWFSTYKVHTRHAERFSKGRCFLAGDSAHIHSPAGGQGMNTGIQDGYNLAWKLALVLRRVANEKLLNTYNEERLANAKNLLRTTDRMFGIAAGEEWWLSFIRLNIFPPLAKYVFTLDSVKSFLFPIVSQIGINYRDSSLSRHDGDESLKAKAGDRVPYHVIDGASIYDRLRQPKFHLIRFSDHDDGDWQAFSSAIQHEYSELVDCESFPLTEDAGDRSFYLFSRPDNYIGFVSRNISLAQVKQYFREFVSVY